jgi:hypothetical protein
MIVSFPVRWLTGSVTESSNVASEMYGMALLIAATMALYHIEFSNIQKRLPGSQHGGRPNAL